MESVSSLASPVMIIEARAMIGAGLEDVLFLGASALRHDELPEGAVGRGALVVLYASESIG
jgi:hypothetical protein